MYKRVSEFFKFRKLRVREDEVLDQLGYGIWRTRDRILELIEENRLSKGLELPLSEPGYILSSSRVKTRSILNRLHMRDIVEIKLESELTSNGLIWSQKESTEDERRVQRQNDLQPLIDSGVKLPWFVEIGHHMDLAYYRLAGGKKGKKRKDLELPDGELNPV